MEEFREMRHGFSRMLIIRFDIKHLSGKQAIELAAHRSKP